ncbi:MAG: Fpg/Nei family DNA glycosylase [Anaerolineae bacterium]
MPELPEVEILAGEMRRHVVGKVAVAIDPFPEQRFEAGQERLPEIVGQPLVGVRRFGKWLALDFGNGLSLLTHLMMVGQWRYSALTNTVPPDVKLTLTFADDTRLYLSGVALRFQRLLSTDEVTGQSAIAGLGPDALSPHLDVAAAAAAMRQRNAGVKALLLEQSLVGGVGNTYADEALFVAAINPKRRTATLSAEEAERLVSAIRQVMIEAIERGGASEMAFVHLDGSEGHYQDVFRVKRKAGQPCPRGDGGAIVKERVAGRPTYYCPKCQV